MKKLKILDWYVHQGHQYEFFKTGHEFYLVNPNGDVPDWNKKHRPLGTNVNLISQSRANAMNFDVVIVRTPIASKIYRPFIQKGAAPVAVIQTADPIWLPPEIQHIVWNSKVAMQAKRGFYRRRQQHHIVHGFDPKEFNVLDIEKNGKILTVANHFKKRSTIMGYDIWKAVKASQPKCEVIGSKNEDVLGAIGHLDSLDQLVRTYNSYSIYFNPTRTSAMPRSRAEAAMCGMPIVTTMNYDFKNYFRSGKDALFSNNPQQLNAYISKLLESEDMRAELGGRAREIAVKHFHINNFTRHWNQVINKALEG